MRVSSSNITLLDGAQVEDEVAQAIGLLKNGDSSEHQVEFYSSGSNGLGHYSRNSHGEEVSSLNWLWADDDVQDREEISWSTAQRPDLLMRSSAAKVITLLAQLLVAAVIKKWFIANVSAAAVELSAQ